MRPAPTRDQLRRIVEHDLADCSDDQRAYFSSVAIEPKRWQQSPWGDESGGFWAVAVDHDRVLWFNDIEEGFNVSQFTVRGTIPEREYWCNQDPLRLALLELATGTNPDGKFGPPMPLSGAVVQAMARLISRLVRRR